MKKIILFFIVLPLVYINFFSEKARLDREVNRLCAIDGGMKVYETVKLPTEKYRRYTQSRTTVPFQELKEDDEYYSVWNTSKLKDGDPDLSRDHYQIIRRSDSRVLGEVTRYLRRGGDLPGPWHSSSYACPEKATVSFLVQRILLIDEE